MLKEGIKREDMKEGVLLLSASTPAGIRDRRGKKSTNGGGGSMASEASGWTRSDGRRRQLRPVATLAHHQVEERRKEEGDEEGKDKTTNARQLDGLALQGNCATVEFPLLSNLRAQTNCMNINIDGIY